MTNNTHWAAPTLAMLTILLTPSLASASWESRGWMGLGAYITQAGTRSTQAGPGGQVGFQLQFNDFLGAVASADISYQLPGEVDNGKAKDPTPLPGTLVSATSLGLQYQFDVIQYVPFLGLSAVFYPNSPPSRTGVPAALFGAKVTVGMQWRLNREWSTAAHIELHTPFSTLGDVSLYTTAGINLGYHWRW